MAPKQDLLLKKYTKIDTIQMLLNQKKPDAGVIVAHTVIQPSEESRLFFSHISNLYTVCVREISVITHFHLANTRVH